MNAVELARNAWEHAGRPGDPNPTLTSLEERAFPITRDQRDRLEHIGYTLCANGVNRDAELLFTLVACWDIST